MTKSLTLKTHHEFFEKYICLYSGSKPLLWGEVWGGGKKGCLVFLFFTFCGTSKALKSPQKNGTWRKTKAVHDKNSNPNPTNLLHLSAQLAGMSSAGGTGLYPSMSTTFTKS